jgi:hypothetical protein
MPQPPAYSPAEVIVSGQRLEASAGVVTQASLHASLGGRGMPSTAWRMWNEYVELRGPWTPPAPSVDPARSGLSESADRAYAEAAARVLAFGVMMRDEADEKHALRAAQTMRMQDDALAAAARLARDLERTRAELDASRQEIDDERAARRPFAFNPAVQGPASSWTPRPVDCRCASRA